MKRMKKMNILKETALIQGIKAIQLLTHTNLMWT